jgi:ubiquinone/menaquinone biosynthesis C-methylase UbiE
MQSVKKDNPTTSTVKTDNAVQSLYSTAASTPQPGLCCPQDYPPEWRSHIPSEAFEYNYGCGSPIIKAGIKPGNVVVDLGSGVGIDSFIAAKYVGAQGKVIGVDMTDAMLERAKNYQPKVADNLGYDVVEFRKGHIEKIPLSDNSTDILVSNCVLNLSTDKELVFKEIHRVLKDGGKVAISDIVVDREIDKSLRQDSKLWSECYTGALSVPNFIHAFENAGFIAITQVDEHPWTEIDGYRFASLTVEAYKFTAGDICDYVGQMAIYLGPYAMVQDEEGHKFPRFQAVEICTDTANRLKQAPYANSFIVTGATRVSKASSGACCDTSTTTGTSSGSCCDTTTTKTEAVSSCCDTDTTAKAEVGSSSDACCSDNKSSCCT